jgi:hypothetical protein
MKKEAPQKCKGLTQKTSDEKRGIPKMQITQNTSDEKRGTLKTQRGSHKRHPIKKEAP